MRRAAGSAAAAALLVLVTACGSPAPDEPAAAPPAAAPASGETLPTPFTAGEIREVWQPGLELVLRFRSPGREEWQRWTVATADADGCEIDYQLLAADGQPLGEPDRKRSSWAELRDHALFPVESARRERYQRETPLGALEGWLYTVGEPEAGTETRMLFADRLPGAPVWMATTAGGEVVLEVVQMERRPAPDGSTDEAREPVE